MEITLDNTEGLPEHLKPLAVEAEGKFKLDLAQVVPASELETFKGKAMTAQQEAIDRRKALDAWKKLGATPEEVHEKLTKGADPQIIEQMRKQHSDEISARDARFQGVLSRVAQAELKAELSKNGVVPEGLDLLANFAASRIRFDDDGNPLVMAEDGKTPMVGSGANGGATLADLAKQIAGKIPHLVKDEGKGGGGKQPPNGNGNAGKAVAAAELESMTPKQKAEFFRKNPGVQITT